MAYPTTATSPGIKRVKLSDNLSAVVAITSIKIDMLKKIKACVFIQVVLASVILYFSLKFNMSTPGRAVMLIYSILPDIIILLFLSLNVTNTSERVSPLRHSDRFNP